MVYEILLQLWSQILLFIPSIISVTIILLIGWVVGWIVAKVAKILLKKFRVDEYIARGGKPIFKLSSILPVIFSWFIYLAFIQSAVEVLGISALVTLLGYIISFLPGLVGAIIVTIVGYAIAEYARQQVEESGITYSGMLGKVLFFFIIYIAIAMALPLIRIDSTLINNILLIVVGSFGIGLAIALGLGLKETVANMAKKYRKKFVK